MQQYFCVVLPCSLALIWENKEFSLEKMFVAACTSVVLRDSFPEISANESLRYFARKYLVENIFNKNLNLNKVYEREEYNTFL